MDVLYLLVPMSVVLVFLIGAVFWFALSSGQFDDLEGPGHRVLDDDDLPPKFDLDQAPPGAGHLAFPTVEPTNKKPRKLTRKHAIQART